MPNRAYSLKRFDILSFNELYNFGTGSFMYQQINQLSPKIIDDITLSREVHNYKKERTLCTYV